MSNQQMTVENVIEVKGTKQADIDEMEKKFPGNPDKINTFKLATNYETSLMRHTFNNVAYYGMLGAFVSSVSLLWMKGTATFSSTEHLIGALAGTVTAALVMGAMSYIQEDTTRTREGALLNIANKALDLQTQSSKDFVSKHLPDGPKPTAV